MALIELTVQHGRTLDDARHRFESAVEEISGRLGAVVRRVEWAPDRNRVTLSGTGFWVEMQLEERAVHVRADLAGLGRLLAPLRFGLKQIVEETFRRLP